MKTLAIALLLVSTSAFAAMDANPPARADGGVECTPVGSYNGLMMWVGNCAGTGVNSAGVTNVITIGAERLPPSQTSGQPTGGGGIQPTGGGGTPAK